MCWVQIQHPAKYVVNLISHQKATGKKTSYCMLFEQQNHGNVILNTNKNIHEKYLLYHLKMES